MQFSPGVVAYVIDPLERAGRTFLQQLVVMLLAVGSAGLLVQQNWAVSLDSAAFAAAVSLLTSIVTFKLPQLSVAADLALRVAKTFVQSFLGTLVAANVVSVRHADWQGALAVAIPVALTALLTGIALLGVSVTRGASALPVSLTKTTA